MSAISDGRGLPRSADWIAKRSERASSPPGGAHGRLVGEAVLVMAAGGAAP